MFYFLLSQPRRKEVFVGAPDAFFGGGGGGWSRGSGNLFLLNFPYVFKYFSIFFFRGGWGSAEPDSGIPCQF